MKTRSRQYIRSLVLVCMAIALFAGCSKSGSSDNEPQPPPDPDPIDTPTVSDVSFWLTRGTQSTLLAKQNTILAFSSRTNQHPIITVDSVVTFQTMVGFGYTLTGGSAQVINGLDNTRRQSLLRELFSTDSTAISVSYLRISIGASDLSASVYTYDDIPAGETDMNLQSFTLDPDRQHLIPILKEIVAINPSIKILATPWTAPLWMKSNAHSVGGSLKPEYYAVYAKYFVKYIQAMAAEGITIDAITPQNEPLHGGNNPSMEMSAAEQTDFIKNHLGPAFEAANISTKIIIYDHNIDRPDYPIEVMNDAGAKQYIDGSAFHLYAGDISTLSMVHRAHPDKHIYFTEQYTASTGSFGGDLVWHVKNLIVGATRNWSRNVLEWNLANDPNYGPHTDGGCTTCKGALTIGQNITRNVAYYIIAHASKFVPEGSVRIMSTHIVSLPNVAFQTPDGKKVLIVVNDSNTSQQFNIRFKDKWVTPSLDAGAVGTFVW